jgi:hypothetical protein
MSGRFMRATALAACAVALLWVTTGIAAEKAAAKPDWKKMDANGDNKLTEGEFNAYVIACPELGLIKTVFQKWDRDKDGTVTYEEYQVVEPMEEGAAPAEKEKPAEGKPM